MLKQVEKTRIAFFLPSLRGGGAERAISKLAIGVAERGLSVDLVLAKAEGPYLKQLFGRVRIVDLGAPRVIRSLPKLVRYLRSARPDSLLSAMDHANLVALLARRIAGVKTKVFASVRTTVSISLQHSAHFRSRIILQLMRMIYRRADGILAVSHGVADDLVHVVGIPERKVRVLYNPVVTPMLLNNAMETPDHPWLNGGRVSIVLSVGRLTRAKDYICLIRAFALLKARREAKLIILGEGEERPRLEALVRELRLQEDVSMPGFVLNPYAYMSRADVFVLSSAWEGLPGVLIEAMACGCPVVSTNCRSGPDEILANGKYGPLVAVGNPAALAEAISQVMESPIPRQELRSRAARFSEECIVREFLEIVR